MDVLNANCDLYKIIHILRLGNLDRLQIVYFNMVETTFKNCFWETDFVTQHGFDAIISRMKDGQKTCRWLEDFFKQRAKAEEDYAKALLKISKYDALF